MANTQTRAFDGHEVKVTHPDKVMYPATGTTKADVIDYFEAIGPYLIAHAANRPATRKRWIDGVGTADTPGEGFFHKNLDEGAPSWIPTHTLKHADHSNRYPLLNSVAVLAWYAQHGTLEFHVPQWRFGERGRPLAPDRMVLDLDPGEGVSLRQCADIAFAVRDALAGRGIESMPVTSGSKGIHLYGALDGTATSDDAAEMIHDLSREVEGARRTEVTTLMTTSERAGKVFLDWSQNRAAKSTVAPYSLRGRLRPWVACPRTWDELGSADLAQVEHEEALELLRLRPDALAALTTVRDRETADPQRHSPRPT